MDRTKEAKMGKKLSQNKIRLISQESNLMQTTESFLNHCEVRDLSIYTINNYRSICYMFAECVNNKPIEIITTDDINDFVLYLRGRGNNNCSIKNRLKVITALLKYAGCYDNIEMPLLKDDNVQKQPYSDEEIKLLLKKPTINSYTEWRNHTICAILLATGIRCRTLANLRIKDLDFVHNTIFLNITKTKKKYYLPMSNELKMTLKHYLSLYSHSDDDYLFVTLYGKQMATTTIKQAIREYNLGRGVRKTSIHLFRHTFAINYLRNGGNIMYLKEVLGHSQLTTTQKYLKVTVEDLKRDFDSVCPLDTMQRKGIKINKQK